MDLLEAVILGIVQGLTEFIPVSSSGHLVLVPALFNWDDRGLAFDAGLHGGTLLAVLVFFRDDWFRMFRASLRDLGSHGVRVPAYSYDARLLLLIALATVPVGVIGLLFDDWVEEHLREPWIVAIALVVAGTAMWIADRFGRRDRSGDAITLRDALTVGVSQAFALVPGVSRSGATITAGLAVGLDRPNAARFGFLIGTPAIGGAVVFAMADLLVGDASFDVNEFVLGFVASAIVGFFAITVLLRYLRSHSLLPFVIYRYGLAAMTLAIAAIRAA